MRVRMTRARALALGAAALAARPTLALAQAPLTIRLGSSTADSYASPYYAIDQGFMAKSGLAVDVTILPNGERLVQAMAGGALDVALADPIQVANAAVAGVPLAFFAGGGLYSTAAPTTLLVVTKNATFRDAKDFEGQTLAVVGLASISALAVKEYLRKGGADLDRVKLVELGFPAMTAAVARGTVAAAFVGEPVLSSGRDDVKPFAKAYDAIGTSFYICAWFATRDWLGKNAEVAKRLTQVAYDTARWANAHQSDTAPILAKYMKLDVDRVRAMTRVTFATTLEGRLMQPVLDAGVRYKQLEKPVDATTLFIRV